MASEFGWSGNKFDNMENNSTSHGLGYGAQGSKMNDAMGGGAISPRRQGSRSHHSSRSRSHSRSSHRSHSNHHRTNNSKSSGHSNHNNNNNGHDYHHSGGASRRGKHHTSASLPRKVRDEQYQEYQQGDNETVISSKSKQEINPQYAIDGLGYVDADGKRQVYQPNDEQMLTNVLGSKGGANQSQSQLQGQLQGQEATMANNNASGKHIKVIEKNKASRSVSHSRTRSRSRSRGSRHGSRGGSRGAPRGGHHAAAPSHVSHASRSHSPSNHNNSNNNSNNNSQHNSHNNLGSHSHIMNNEQQGDKLVRDRSTSQESISRTMSRTGTPQTPLSQASQSSNRFMGSKMTYKKSQIRNPLTYNAIQSDADPDCIVLTRNADERPVTGRSYFSKPMPIGLDAKDELNLKRGINVFIPIFDQEATQLEKTLTMLHENFQVLKKRDSYWKDKPFHICLVQDGWKNADASMQSYLKKLFPKVYVINNSDSGSANLDPQSGMARLRTISISGSQNGGTRKATPQARVPSQIPSHSSVSVPPTPLPQSMMDANQVTQSRQLWWDFHEEFAKDYLNASNEKTTFVFEKSFQNKTYFQNDFREMNKKRNKKIENQLNLNMSLIIKIDHRGKYNSQQWFMGREGFCDVYQSKFIFLTEMGCIMEEDCLCELVEHIEFSPECAVAIGNENIGTSAPFIVNLSRHSSYAFENSYINAIYSPIFNSFGFVPYTRATSYCSVYRSSDVLQDSVRNFYFGIVNPHARDLERMGIMKGNLRGSPNRLLGFATCAKSADTRHVSIVKNANFSRECDMSAMDEFLFRRRQSVNYAVFSIFWFLLSPSSVFGVENVSCFGKIKLWLFVIALFFQSLVLFVSPAITFSLLNFVLLYIGNSSDDNSGTLEIIIYVAFGLWIASFLAMNRMKMNQIILMVLYIISCGISFGVVWAGISEFVINSENIRNSIQVSGIAEAQIDILFALLFISIFLPFSCSFMVDNFSGLCHLVTGFIHYIFSCHFQLSFLSIYCIGQCWNCANSEYDGRNSKTIGDAFIASRIESMENKYQRGCYIIMAVIILFNLFFYYGLSERDKFQCFVLFMIVVSFITLSSFLALIGRECGDESERERKKQMEDSRANLRAKDRARRAVAGATANEEENGLANLDPDIRSEAGDSVYDEDIHGAMANQQAQQLYQQQQLQYVPAPPVVRSGRHKMKASSKSSTKSHAEMAEQAEQAQQSHAENNNDDNNNNNKNNENGDEDNGSVYDEDITYAMENNMRVQERQLRQMSIPDHANLRTIRSGAALSS